MRPRLAGLLALLLRHASAGCWQGEKAACAASGGLDELSLLQHEHRLHRITVGTTGGPPKPYKQTTAALPAVVPRSTGTSANGTTAALIKTAPGPPSESGTAIVAHAIVAPGYKEKPATAAAKEEKPAALGAKEGTRLAQFYGPELINKWVNNEDFGYWFYFTLLVLGNAFLWLQTAGLLTYFLKAAHWRWKFGPFQPVLPREGIDTVSIIVPCYMPNEHPIIEGTLDHILNRLEYEPEVAPLSGDPAVTIYCVYNGPPGWSHPIEETLQRMDGRRMGKWRRLVRVVRVPGSQSKAANLNYAIEQIRSTYTAIYDADHYPEPPSLRLALSHLLNEEADCVQGSTYVRGGLGLLGMLIDAEFFANYFTNMCAASMIVGNGWFGGSNALWSTAFLRSQQFNTKVQTEDIEFSVQSLRRNARISFCPQARSGELPPAGLRALWRQRIRWMMGWDQVTFMHTCGITKSSQITCSHKLGLFWLLIVRWFTLILGLVMAVVQPMILGSFMVYNWAQASAVAVSFDGPVSQIMVYGMVPSFFTLGSIIGNILVYERPRGRMLRQLLFSALFLQMGPVYLVFQFTLTVTSLTRILTGRVGDWLVTTRYSPDADPEPGRLAAADCDHCQGGG